MMSVISSLYLLMRAKTLAFSNSRSRETNFVSLGPSHPPAPLLTHPTHKISALTVSRKIVVTPYFRQNGVFL